MNWIETILVILGISLDIFAAMACKGAQLSKIERKPMVTLCMLFALWQTAALYIGSASGEFLRRRDTHSGGSATEIIAVVIFGVLGILMIRKAWKNEQILERRDDEYAWKGLITRLALISITTLVVGAALGFLGTNTVIVLTAIAAVTVVVVIAGLYVGYHWGYEQKTKAYAVGGVLLLAGAVDTVVRFVLV
jgi:putative Mn2+ efflux pump MntP